MMAWLRIALVAALALAAVYAYAALALVARARLATRPPPRTRLAAALVGALVPACGCTALPFARRCAPRERAAFVTAAYALNPLLVLAALVVAGIGAALAVAALALLAAGAHAALRPLASSPAPRVRLDDLLLKHDAAPWRDALPYAREFAPPAVAAGLVVGLLTFAPPFAAGLGIAALVVALGPPRAELALDHGPAFARRALVAHVVFAVVTGATTGVLA